MSAPGAPTAATVEAAAARLFALIPTVYRIRDAEQGGVLADLVHVLAGRLAVLEEDLAGFYDDQFVETAAEWVTAYLGDLVGYTPLDTGSPAGLSRRAEVAHTVGYRRRKGTASMLEQLAHDVTGRPARAVEYFERLATTQYLNHLRPHAVATAPVREAGAMAAALAAAGAFSGVATTPDVRRIGTGAPRPSIRNVGLVLWRTAAWELAGVPLVDTGDGRRFRFDALGTDVTLFTPGRPELDPRHLAGPDDVPRPLTRRELAGPTALTAAWGHAFRIDDVDVTTVHGADLADVGAGAWAHEPAAGEVAVDAGRGRVWFGTAPADPAAVTGMLHTGVAVPVGAGGFERSLAVPDVVPRTAAAGPLQPDLDAVAAGGMLVLADNLIRTGATVVRTDPPAVAGEQVTLEVRAANHRRPLLRPTGPLALELAAGTEVRLDGLLVAGAPVVLAEVGPVLRRTVTLRYCSLVPGQDLAPDATPVHPERASLLVLDPFADVVLDHCVVGPIVAVEGSTVTVVDSVIDAGDTGAVAFCGREPVPGGLRGVATVADQQVGPGTTVGGSLDLVATTVVGGIHATRLDASNAMLLATLPTGDPRPAAVWAERQQVGCLRFSFVPDPARVPPRFHCVSAPWPDHTSLRFGDPGYGQLRSTTGAAVARGADDESEMGVGHQLFDPQREDNLRTRLLEYLRFGLEAGVIHAD